MIGQYPTPPEGILIANAIRRVHAATSHASPAGLTLVGVTVGRVIDVPTPPEPEWKRAMPLLSDPLLEPTPIGDQVEREQRAARFGLPAGWRCGSTETKSGQPCGWRAATCPHHRAEPEPFVPPGHGLHRRDDGAMNAYWLVAVAAGICLWLLIITINRGWLT